MDKHFEIGDRVKCSLPDGWDTNNNHKPVAYVGKKETDSLELAIFSDLQVHVTDTSEFPPKVSIVKYRRPIRLDKIMVIIPSGLGGAFTLTLLEDNNDHAFFRVVNPGFENIVYKVEES